MHTGTLSWKAVVYQSSFNCILCLLCYMFMTMPVAQRKKKGEKRETKVKKLHTTTTLAFLLAFYICSDIS